jgi:hypothetical protein
MASALAKPKDLFVYGSPALPSLAASCAAGIILNRPFLFNPSTAKLNFEMQFALNVRQDLTNPQIHGRVLRCWRFGSSRWSRGGALQTHCKNNPAKRKNSVRIQKKRLKNPRMKALAARSLCRFPVIRLFPASSAPIRARWLAHPPS